MDFLDKITKYLDIPGILADPPDGYAVKDGEVVLTRELILALIAKKEEFFDAVPVFHPLKRSAVRAIETLEKKGLINSVAPLKKGGCASCIRKSLTVIFLQLLRHMQTMFATFHDKGTLSVAGDQIRGYLKADKNSKLIVYLRSRDNELVRLEF